MIYIDFQGGSHGNFLEFVTNKFIGNVAIAESLPFNAAGASHQKHYLTDKVFECDHYFSKNQKFANEKIISIQITTHDLLPLQCVSLLRAGNYNINPELLEIDTYHKLDNDDYRWVRDNIEQSYFLNQIVDSYQAVSDPSWPEVKTLEDYANLPQHIKDECEHVHNLKLYQFDKDHPNCSRHILRDFFTIGFLNPEQHGFMTQQKRMTYDRSCDVMVFPFGAFYDTQKFAQELSKIAAWAGLTFDPNNDEFVKLHQQFLSRQPYKNAKHYCDNIVEKLLLLESFELPRLDVIQESYINAEVQQRTGYVVPNESDQWFVHSSQIISLIGSKQKNKDRLVLPYNPDVWEHTNFPNLKSRIDEYYDIVFDTVLPYQLSPRYVFEMGKKLAFRDIFYYIDLLYVNQPSTVIDVGSGECVWKRWFPNILGFDPNTNPFTSQDFVDTFDKEFSDNHQGAYDCGLAVNSLHFVDWNDAASQIDLAMNIVRDRFLFTFNFDIFRNTPTRNYDELFDKMLDIINRSNYDVIMLDCPAYRGYNWLDVQDWFYMNGSIRFILAHK